MTQFEPGKIVAIVIGLEKYEHVPELPGPINDSIDFIEWMIKVGVPADNIVLVASPLNSSQSQLDHMIEATGIKPIDYQAGGTREVTYQSVRNGLSQLQQMCIAHKPNHLIVFASGHGAVLNRDKSILVLPDYKDDDMQFLDVNNLLGHFSSDFYEYPTCQTFIFDMCSSTIDTRSLGVAPASNTLQLGASEHPYQVEAIFAAAIGRIARLNNESRRSEFWLQLKPELQKLSHIIFPFITSLREAFPAARGESHNVLVKDVDGGNRFLKARWSRASKRRAWGVTLTFLLFFLIAIGYIRIKKNCIASAIADIQASQNVDDLFRSVEQAKRSYFRDSIQDQIRSNYDRGEARSLVANLVWDGKDSSSFNSAIGNQKDREVQTQLILYLANSVDQTELLVKFLEESLDERSKDGERTYVFAMVLSAHLEKNQKAIEKLDEEFLKKCVKSYSEHDDPGVHSALFLLLRRARYDTTDVDRRVIENRSETKIVDRLKSKLVLAPTWYVTPDKRTMVIVPPGTVVTSKPENWKDHNNCVSVGPIQVSHWFAVSTMEVTNDEFLEFAGALAKLKETTIEKLFPKRTTGKYQAERWIEDRSVAATRISWIDAMRYCQWRQSRFDKNSDGFFTEDNDGKSVLLSSELRLPLESEWELACRYGSTTNYFFGSSEKVQEVFSQFGKSVNNKDDGQSPQKPGLKLPNRLGLFDLYGNAEEWCIDPWRDDITTGENTIWKPAGSTQSPARPLRGSSAGSGGQTLFSSFRQSQGEFDCPRYGGMRLAKTIIIR